MTAELPVGDLSDEMFGGPARRYCFVEGTHISTLRGDMPVEQLRVGEHIRAKKGSFHVVTEVCVVAFDDLDPSAQGGIGLYPIRRGAFEEGLPRRDFYVSAGQQFELSRRLEVAHAVRMAVRKEGAALRGLRFVVFTCPGLPMIRAEGIWTTETPLVRLFPRPAEGPADAAETPEAAMPEAPPEAAPEPVPEPAPDAMPVLRVPVPPAVVRAGPTRRRVTRFLRSPVLDPVTDPVPEPGPHHTGTGTPAP